MKNIKMKYKADGLTIIWQPVLCSHAGICVRMLPEVYRPTERPWVRPQFANKEQLIRQIDACPTGALSYELDESTQDIDESKQDVTTASDLR